MDEATRAVRDHQEIVAVCVRYATALDRRDWGLLRTCFAPDVVAAYQGIGTLEGYQAVEDVCRRALEPLAASQHLLGNHDVTVDGDVAHCSTYFQAQHVRPGTEGGDLYVVAGTYTDRMTRGDAGWRIAHRRLDVVWTDGNTAVLGL